MIIVKITNAFVTPYDQQAVSALVNALPLESINLRENDQDDYRLTFDIDDNAFRFVARLFLTVRMLDNRAVFMLEDD